MPNKILHLYFEPVKTPQNWNNEIKKAYYMYVCIGTSIQHVKYTWVYGKCGFEEKAKR